MIEIKVPAPRKLDSGNWFIQVRANGKSKSFTDADKTKCLARAQAYKAGILLEEEKRSHPNLTVAIDKYIEARSNVLSPSTIRGYKAIQKNRFKDAMKRKIDSIDKAGWQRICNAETKLCSAKTLTNSWRFISSVIYEETGRRFDIRLPQIVSNEKPFLEPDDIKPFMDAIKSSKAETAALLALSSLRRSELLALRWDNVDLENGMILVSGAAVYDENEKLIYKKENKNRTSRRYVPILMDRLKELLETTKHVGEYVVTVAPTTIRRNINEACKRAGLLEVGVHGLRHSFASLAYHLNIPEKIAMEIGGWSNDQTMNKIYTHISKKDVNRYKTALTDYFKSIQNNQNANADANEP